MPKPKKNRFDELHVNHNWFESYENKSTTNVTLIVLFIVVITLSWFTIAYLWSRLANVEESEKNATEVVSFLTMKNNQLRHDLENLNQKEVSSSKTEDSIDILKPNIAKQVNNATPQKNKPQEIKEKHQADHQTLYALVRSMMLYNIPNGEPIKDNYSVSSPFGARVHPILRVWKSHTGIDLATDAGIPVYATADGIVEYAKDSRGYGNLLKIRHAFGFTTYYAHLRQFEVDVGQFIRKGDLVARVGSTGEATGPHLHYEVRFLDNPLQPSNFIFWSNDNFNSLFTKEDNVNWRDLAEIILEQVRNQLQEIENSDKLKKKNNVKRSIKAPASPPPLTTQ